MLKKLFQKNNYSIFSALAILLLVFFFRYFLDQDFQQEDFLKIFIFYFFAFFLLPWGLIRFFYKQKMEEFFLINFSWKNFQDKKLFFLINFFWIGIFSLFMLKFNQWKNFPVSPWILNSWDLIIFLELSFLPLILFFQEFFYRGFLLKIFSEKMDVWLAISLQALLAIFFEIIFNERILWLGGVLFIFYCFLGWISLRNKNFLFSWMVSFFFSVLFDLIILYKFYIN